MNLSQAKPTPKQLNLNKLGDAGGSQIHWPATLAKTDSSGYVGISLKTSCPNGHNSLFNYNVHLKTYF